MLADVPVIETLDAEIIENLEQIGQIEQGEIRSVLFPRPVLNPEVNTEDESRFYQQIDKNQQ
jgi:hypothetical protein